MELDVTTLGKTDFRRAQIEELDGGWRLTDSDGLDEVHPTAAEAQQALKQRDQALASEDVSIVTTLTWATHSRLGRLIVRAITGTPK